MGCKVNREDYARAEEFLPHNAQKNVYGVVNEIHWTEEASGEEDQNLLWYMVKDRKGKEFKLVDPASGDISPAFDHQRLASSLSRLGDEVYEAGALPFDRVYFADAARAVEFVHDENLWRCCLHSYECCRLGEVREGEVLSPDRKWVAFSRDHNLWIRRLDTGEEFPLTEDGERDLAYAGYPDSCLSSVTDRLKGRTPEAAVSWSPDSERILTHLLDQRGVETIHLLQSQPAEGFRPEVHSYRYPLPGEDRIPTARLVVADVESKTADIIDSKPLQAMVRPPVQSGLAWWSEDGEEAYFLRFDRGFTEVSLQVLDAKSGRVRKLYSESGQGCMGPFFTHSDSPMVKVLSDRGEILWFSQQDGWGQLYLIDRDGGQPLRQLTRGSWAVRQIVHVNEEEGKVYFLAGGREADRDPYFRHLYRLNMDDDDPEPELLTPEDADHFIVFSPDGGYFADVYSRVDLPPAAIVRRSDGRNPVHLEKADAEGLQEMGWTPPRRFSVKARDGVTDLYGVVYYPTDFDPDETYPVIDSIYPGPQVIRTPKRFPQDPQMARKFWQPQALAELGFVVITVDGMGTPFRSRRFHQRAFGQDFGEAGGLEDHVTAIKQLARRHSYMDAEKVGIYGHSGGGYASTRALLKFPDFFDVAVSSAGNHDQRGYQARWGEYWIGFPKGPELYSQQSNIQLADNLQGKLLLVHGDLDDNVHPALTLQMAYALMEADRDFDMLILPGRNHRLQDLTHGKDQDADPQWTFDPYFTRRLWDYFVQHLHGTKPPGYSIKSRPG